MDYQKILGDIQARKFYPVYFLTGEETYFIDLIAEKLGNSILVPEEREFNQSVLYGSDYTVSSIIDMAKRFPMLASYQVIIIKEAQELKDIEAFAPYIEKVVPTTILVLCYKYKKVDKRKAFAKALQSKGVFFESKKLYDNQVADWIIQFVKSRGYGIDLKSAMVLTENIGTDLSRVVTEIEKLLINIQPGAAINLDLIEKFIGISKDFNVFELQKAIGERNVFKANQIAYFMAANPKENPIQKTLVILHSFFVKLLIFHSLPSKEKGAVTSALGINPFFVNDYQRAAQHYPTAKIESVISVLREYDLKSKGVNSESTPDEELTRELLYKILH
jgi:DNA polymerase-3 subunit delta